MAWQVESKSDAVVASLDRIIPEYKCVSDAPPFSYFENQAPDSLTQLHQLMLEEQKKQYKCVDTRTGDVFLCRNPALMTYQCWLGRSPIHRQLPTFLMSRQEALDLIRGRDKEYKNSHTNQNSSWD